MTRPSLFDRQPPRLVGRWLAAAAAAAENPLLSGPLAQRMLADSGITAALSVAIEEPPTGAPLWPAPAEPGSPLPPSFLTALPAPAPPPLPVARARDYHERYLRGELTPEQVAERALSAIAALDRMQPPLRAFVSVDEHDVLGQAQQSAARYREGRPLSVLDGVPVAIKDELDLAGHPTRGGTTFMGRGKAVRDAGAVARLRAAGALLLGKTHMHEIGIQPTGWNAHYGQCRNPYDRGRDSGGSSSGSAAAVAAGLCPIALGADGGGSVRVPAALCGVVGLKATFGRVSETGVVPLCFSVGHVGPLAASVEDLALAYAAIAGPDARDPASSRQPPPSLAGWDAPDLTGVRLGVDRGWMADVDREVLRACESALERLCALGATVRDVSIADLELQRVAHNITILAEMAQSLGQYPESPAAHGPGVRLALGVARRLQATDFVWAQRVRTRAMARCSALFADVDVIVTPSTAITAPVLPDPMPAEGWLDVNATLQVMRFAFVGNLLGLPALTLPAGYDAGGMPIGVQLMGAPWQEALLLRTARLLETRLERRLPQTHVDLLR